MIFNFFKRGKKGEDSFNIELEDDNKLYYQTIAGRTPRDINNREEYILFIDFGSYRTSVLCWPCCYGREKITDTWRYVVHYKNGEIEGGGFPSAFINPPSGDERDFAFIDNFEDITVASSQIVKSAKSVFASKFAAYKGAVPQFRLYIKKVLEESFQYITAPVEGRPWNSSAIPVITEIRVTVPDLFIENLRAGYRENIYSVCMEFLTHKKWKQLFPTNLRSLKKTFINISADESGACELYFLNLIKLMPFWDLSSEKDRVPDLKEVEFLFSQKRKCIENNNPNRDKKELNFVVCHVDIGGLTTDASILLMRSFNDHDLGITTTLKRKESFSEKKAGEYFAEAFKEIRHEDDEDHWWESDRFIQKEFGKFLELLFGKQYALLNEWRKEKSLDGIYFLISGRPTKAQKIRDIISRYILKEFNKESLLLLPEHCLFMADYYHVGKNEEGERYAKKIENFEKLITILGNVYTLYDGYEIDFDEHKYYISLDVDTRGVQRMEILPGRQYNMEDFENYQKAAQRNNVLHLAFTRIASGENGTRFLTVKKIARQTAYPIIKIADKNEFDDQAWITPSLIITNLNDNDQAFDLAWASHV
ncbi:MAG: hypothetical protein HQK64_00305 [Desulfamplus sp.]|nr:hypothetical protein [Desulfamplus sp.]MBF0388843.1 hypothetical protein [Desulfamplus sp.]